MESDKAQMLLSAKTMMSIAGALWVVFGLALTTLLKDVVLGERTPMIGANVARWVVRVIAGFFVVNFCTITVVQSFGVWLIAKESAGESWLLWVGDVAALACYLFMAWSALCGVQVVFGLSKAAKAS